MEGFPTVLVPHELHKAAEFTVFIDADMMAGFHQLRIDKPSSEKLAIVTDRELLEPTCMPEGVKSATAYLNKATTMIFEPYLGWLLVIHDNITVMAYDLHDLFRKWVIIINRCREFNVILKLKKTWMGFRRIKFFGFIIENGTWRLSDERVASIDNIPFPKNKKGMQRALGAFLFFHHHIPNYSDQSKPLYRMLNDDFIWTPSTWDYDYVGHFNRFKEALKLSYTLHLPDYSLDWELHVDASDLAVGAVLAQIRPMEDGTKRVEPLDMASKALSISAQKWDPHKKEAFACYWGINHFSYFLMNKYFVLFSDHRNLQWLEQNHTPICIRWLSHMQGYNFMLKHISGVQNHVADWLSRLPYDMIIPAPELSPNNVVANLQLSTDVSGFSFSNDLYLAEAVDRSDDTTLTFESVIKSVHGDRQFHHGYYETWKRAKAKYPTIQISLAAVREYILQCPICQKTRDLGIKPLPSTTLHLKPDTYRRTIGIDHFTVTPIDENGYCACVMVVEFFARFPQAYPVKSYDANTLATVLFIHFFTFGMFDELADDPGSAMMSDVVTQLNRWLGVRHKVSLVGRHESNGCEGPIKQYLRHLRTLVFDERLKNRWASPTVISLINFHLCSYATSETGGFTPFQLKYGTQDASYFQLPNPGETGQRAATFIRLLDEDLRIIRTKSLQLQREIILERQKQDGPPQQYVVGDLILFNHKEKPSDMLPEKLFPRLLGPYRVISQAKNDITCEHLVNMDQQVLHNSRCIPFLGSEEDAFLVAKLDKNQFKVIAINYYKGNVHIRKSLIFNVTFEDNDLKELYHNADFTNTNVYQQYIKQYQWLIPLQYTSTELGTYRSKINKERIIFAGTAGYLHLRYYDSDKLAWYDTLPHPNKRKEYIVAAEIREFISNNRKVNIYVTVLNKHITLSHYEVQLYLISVANYESHDYYEIVNDTHVLYEQLLPYRT